MKNNATNPRVRTLVVVDTETKRHVFELDAKAEETWEDPRFNDPHAFGPHRLEVNGTILRHVVYDRSHGDELLPDQAQIETPGDKTKRIRKAE